MATRSGEAKRRAAQAEGDAPDPPGPNAPINGVVPGIRDEIEGLLMRAYSQGWADGRDAMSKDG